MKTNKISFEDKVRAMSAKEIIMSMVDGLMHPTTRVNMSTYGYSYRFLGVNIKCYGCAATNTILKIGGIKYKHLIADINSKSSRAKLMDTSYTFLDRFESAIDYLRLGMVKEYNLVALEIGISKINKGNRGLPELHTYTYKEDLHDYIQLANAQ